MNPFPDFEYFERRYRSTMREFVRHIMWQVEDGNLTPKMAGEEMTKVGVPFEVQCRIINKAKNNSK